MEKIRDLLNDKQKELKIQEDPKLGIKIQGLEQINIHNYYDAITLYQKGVKNRVVGETSRNLKSSRSHAIFTL